MARQCSKDELSIWDKYSEKLEPLRTEHYAKDEPSANFESFGDRKNGLEKRKFEDDRIRPKQSESEIRDRRAHRQAHRMDRKLRNKMIRGKIEPESLIDLHGKNRLEAEIAVSRFIHSAYRTGHRLVLVITGKGRNETRQTGVAQQPGGILKNQVARQLAAPPLSDRVLEFHRAHPRHGGDGAYYVYLKRRKEA